MPEKTKQPETVEVTFKQPWSGSFNGFKVDVTKFDFMTKEQISAANAEKKYKGPKRTVPVLMAEWIKQFDVVR